MRMRLRRHHVDADVVHEEGGRGDEGFVAVVEEGAAEEVDGLVDAVGEEDLVGLEAEVRGDVRFDVLALGVDGEALRRWSRVRRSRTRGEGAKVFSLKSRRRQVRSASGGWYSGMARTGGGVAGAGARRGCCFRAGAPSRYRRWFRWW